MPELYQDPIFFVNKKERITGITHIPDALNHNAVIMLHGWTGNMHSHGHFIECAHRLCDAGFLVLRFDFRGSEHSEGNFEDITIKGGTSDFSEALIYSNKVRSSQNRCPRLQPRWFGIHFRLESSHQSDGSMVLSHESQ